MGKERINEMVDFAKSECPYKSANKGLLSKDIYIYLGKY